MSSKPKNRYKPKSADRVPHQSGPEKGEPTGGFSEEMQENDRVVYYIPELPIWETMLYMAIFACHSAYSVYAVWSASSHYKHHLNGGYFEPGWAVLGGPRQDVANYEWQVWTRQAARFMPWFAGHALLFNCSDWLFGRWHRHVMFAYWSTALVWIYSWWVVAVTVACGVVMLVVAQFELWLVVWAFAVGLLFAMGMTAQEFLVKWADQESIYEYEVFMAYKLIQFISYCIHDIKRRQRRRTAEIVTENRTTPSSILFDAAKLEPKFDPAPIKSDDHRKSAIQDNELEIGFSAKLYQMLFYSFYPPYAISIIVLYPDFEDDLARRAGRERNWRRTGSLALRIAFWWIFIEFIMHYLFLNALIMEPEILGRVAQPTLASIGYLTGQHFHLKYIVIFGLPQLFAYLDNLDPPGMPICISRVALYGNMWRYFDKGLYKFMREMIFIPIALPSFSYARRFLATAMCFVFVWIWHTPTWFYLVWILMNFAEVNLENFGRMIWRHRPFREGVNRRLSAQMSRRLLAVAHVPCIALGVFGIFYFLGTDEAGDVFVRRLIWENCYPIPKLKMCWLLSLGYVFANVCMEIQRLERNL